MTFPSPRAPGKLVPERRFVQVPGATVGYTVQGSGAPLLLGHSLLLDGAMWERVISRWAPHFRIINIDARAHGTSRAQKPFTVDDLARDWLAVLDAERIDAATLVGLSMGGMSAMRAAALAPERVRRLVLFDTSAGSEGWYPRAKYLAMAEIVKRAGLLQPLFGTILPLFFSSQSLNRDPELATWLEARIRAQDPRQLALGVSAVVNRTNVLPALAGLQIPTLVLVGSADKATPPVHAKRLVGALPQAQLHIFEGVGHVPPLEVPANAADAVLRWLGAGRRAARSSPSS